VLSLPDRLQYLLAWDHDLCRAVTGVFVRAVLGSLRRRAGRAGAPHGRGGAVAILQRFGAALNLNVHVHALVLDGVYVEDGQGGLRFHALPAPLDEEMDAVHVAGRHGCSRSVRARGINPRRNYLWAGLMQRTFGLDVLVPPLWGSPGVDRAHRGPAVDPAYPEALGRADRWTRGAAGSITAASAAAS
jgi:hypothetical protein